MSENGNNRSRGERTVSVKNARNTKTASGSAHGKSTGSASGQSKNTGSNRGGDAELGRKAAVVVFVILLVFLFLCNFGIIGVVGEAVSGFLFGVFGFLAYITPVCIGALFFGYKYGKHKPDAMKIIISSVCLYFLIAIICDMVSKTGVGMSEYSFSELYKLGRDGRCGGGLVSGSIAYLIKSLIGTVGLVLFLILGIIICLLFITRGYLWTFISGLFTNYINDREVRVAGREERKARELEQRQLRQLESGKGSGGYIEDKNSADKSLLRNRPLPGFLNGGTDQKQSNDESSQNSVENSRSNAENLQNAGDSQNNSEQANRNISNDNKQNVDEDGHVLTTREKFRQKVTAINDKAKRERSEKRRLNEEARENNEILKKISVPKDDRPSATRYSSHSEEMHEVYVDMQGDIVSESEAKGTADGLNSGDSFDNGAGVRGASGISGSGYPDNYKVGGRSAGAGNSSSGGMNSSVHNANFEKISIKKQDIRSEHSVNITEDYEPINIKSDTPYNPDNDPDKFDESPIDYAESFSGETAEGPQPDASENISHSDSKTDTENTDEIYAEAEKNAPFDKPEDDEASYAQMQAPDSQNSENGDHDPEVVEKPGKYSSQKYKFPPLTLLNPGKNAAKADENELKETARRLEETLRSFGVSVNVNNYVQGPTVTRFEMTLEPGTKVSKILSLADDIKLSLASADVRIEAPIPGKSAVGIEVPNSENSAVALRTLLENDNFKKSSSVLSFAVGMDIGGETIVTDIAKMPHVLIAGSTGSGKSVCINTLIMSIIYKATPEEVQMILIDPKVVELSVYNGIPHLAIPVVTDPQKASAALDWGVKEMDERYKKFADMGVRDLKGFNDNITNSPEKWPQYSKLPKIVIIIDELADLMMTCGKEVEASICRLAQLARACGIHLVVATQRPSVDVITGLIKANMPSRMAFAVKSGVDSRTILDTVGAEKLLGKGDMLFYPQGKSKPERVQGAFVSDEEVADVVQFLLAQKLGNPFADTTNINLETVSREDDDAKPLSGSGSGNASSGDADDRDEFYAEAGRLIINTGKASMGFLQRKFKIGFNRAARIMDNLAEDGVVGEESGTKAREILMTIEQFESFLDDNGIK